MLSGKPRERTVAPILMQQPPSHTMILITPSFSISSYRIIQNTWRCFVNVRIFQYYRDLICFHRSCDPASLLRHISPKEADLFVRDAAIGIHVRFRLGGASFPPVLLYKVSKWPRACIWPRSLSHGWPHCQSQVFTHSPLCDVNAFAPRVSEWARKGKQWKVVHRFEVSNKD